MLNTESIQFNTKAYIIPVRYTYLTYNVLSWDMIIDILEKANFCPVQR